MHNYTHTYVAVYVIIVHVFNDQFFIMYSHVVFAVCTYMNNYICTNHVQDLVMELYMYAATQLLSVKIYVNENVALY